MDTPEQVAMRLLLTKHQQVDTTAARRAIARAVTEARTPDEERVINAVEAEASLTTPPAGVDDQWLREFGAGCIARYFQDNAAA